MTNPTKPPSAAVQAVARHIIAGRESHDPDAVALTAALNDPYGLHLQAATAGVELHGEHFKTMLDPFFAEHPELKAAYYGQHEADPDAEHKETLLLRGHALLGLLDDLFAADQPVPLATDLARMLILPKMKDGEYLYDALAQSLASDDAGLSESLAKDAACGEQRRAFVDTLMPAQREQYERWQDAEMVLQKYTDAYTALLTLQLLFSSSHPKGKQTSAAA